MAGLVPAISIRKAPLCAPKRDRRVKPGDDEVGVSGSRMEIIIIGLLLGGTYALMAMGLQLQYGVACIMNLANGEVLIAGAFGAFWFYAGTKTSPLLSLLFVVPLAFVLNYAIYRVLILPLVRRAKSQGKLEVDSILATFGLSFIFIGIMVAVF